MRGLKRTRWVAGAAVVALAVTACGGDDPADDPAPGGSDAPSEDTVSGGTFSVQIGEPEAMVPGNTNETSGGEVLGALFSGLVKYDAETSEPSNLVAASIESEDATTWTVTLNEGWTFHNGDPVNAQSFVDSWNYTSFGPNAYGNNYFFANIVGYCDLNPGSATSAGEVCPGDAAVDVPTVEEMSGLEVVDETTFTVELEAPFSQFPLTLGYTAFYPMPAVAFDDIDAYQEAPIGNGPFKMDGEWVHNQQINVVKFEEYGGEPAQADGIEFRIYSDPNTAYNDLLAGELDIVDSVPPEQVVAAAEELGDRFLEGPSSSFTYIGFPLFGDTYQDPDIRRAISMAIDRQAIIDAIFNGTRTPATSVVSPVVAGARTDVCQYCVYDVEAAQALWESSGGLDTVELTYNADGPHQQWIEAVGNQLQQNLGVTPTFTPVPLFADYLGQLDAETVTGMFRLGWVMDYPSPQNYLEPIHSTNGSSNNTGYSNPEVDALIAEGNQAASLEEGIAAYNAAEDIILDEMPIVPMWFGLTQGAHSENVENVVIDAFTSIRLEDVTVVNP